MNTDLFLSAVGGLSDDLLDAHFQAKEAYQARRATAGRRAAIKWGVLAAACLCAVACAIPVVKRVVSPGVTPGPSGGLTVEHSPGMSSEFPTIAASAVLHDTGEKDLRDEFDIVVKYGQIGSRYTVAEFEVRAENFTVVTDTGEKQEHRYQKQIHAFNDGNYLAPILDQSSFDFFHSETYTFRYIGDAMEASGYIVFILHTFVSEERFEENSPSEGCQVSFYYEIKDGEFTWYTEKPQGEIMVEDQMT